MVSVDIMEEGKGTKCWHHMETRHTGPHQIYKNLFRLTIAEGASPAGTLGVAHCVNLRCTGRVTISIKRGNDRPAQSTYFLAFARKKPRARTCTAVDIKC